MPLHAKGSGFLGKKEEEEEEEKKKNCLLGLLFIHEALRPTCPSLVQQVNCFLLQYIVFDLC